MNTEYENKLIELGVPLVDLSKMNPQYCKEICDALNMMFKLYPALSRSLCAIGDIKSVIGYVLQDDFLNSTYDILTNNNIDNKSILDFKNDNKGELKCGEYDNFLKSDMWYHNKTANMTFCYAESYIDITDKFSAIFFCDTVYKGDLRYAKNSSNLIKVFFTNEEIKHKFWHELGHLFDHFIGVSKDKEYLELLAKHDLKYFLTSNYLKTPGQTFAELFSIINSEPEKEYATNNELKVLINKKYKEMISNNNYNDKYDLTSKYLIEEKRRGL